MSAVAEMVDLDITLEMLAAPAADDLLVDLMKHLAEVTVWCDIEFDSERDQFHVRGQLREGRSVDSRFVND